MSLLTTHFSRAYSPRVAFNSATGFDSPESPGHQWPLSILLTAFLLIIVQRVEVMAGWAGRPSGLPVSRRPVCQTRPTCHPLFDGFFEVKTGEANGHAFHQCRFTPAGLSWIAGRFVEVAT